MNGGWSGVLPGSRVKGYNFGPLSFRNGPQRAAEPENTMIRVTRLTDYATLLMTVLATAPDTVHSASMLAERTRLEPATVSKVLKALAQSGLVEGLRGANGGYRLAQAPLQISLLEIVEAIEGPLEMTECSGEHSRCEHETFCGVAPHWRLVNDVIADTLRGMTLAQMLEPLPPPSRQRRIDLRLATS